MFLNMQKGLKSIDFYQAVPSQLSQGTISGACLSIISISTLIILIIITSISHFQPAYGSDLIIDHQHLDKKLRLNIDISFPRYPCSMLSLDIENILKVHQVNIGNTIRKYNLPSNQLFEQTNDYNEKKRRIKQDFQTGKGCRMKGWFQIDRVPGNFHFSCHGYGDVVTQYLNQGGLNIAHKNIDLTHQIHQFWFGDKAEPTQMKSALKNFKSSKQIGEAFLGISYTYFLDIVQTNHFSTTTQQSNDNYYYTVRMNEVILGTFPMVFFKYQTNPITVFSYSQNPPWHQLFVKIVGIIGGIFTIGIIIDGMIHTSIRFLVEKHRLNKLT